MKIKKLLAAAVSAALAVSTMAVTSFSVSAAAASSLPEGTETKLADFKVTTEGSSFPLSFTGWESINIQADAAKDDLESWLTDSSVYIKVTADMTGTTWGDNSDSFASVMSWGWDNYNSWVTIGKFYNNWNQGASFEVAFPPLSTSTETNAVSYVLISDFGIDEWGCLQGSLQGNGQSFKVKSVQIVKFNTDTTVYQTKTYTPVRADGASDSFFYGTWNFNNAVGPNARVEFTFNKDMSSGYAVCDGEAEGDFWTHQTFTNKASIKLSDLKSAGITGDIVINSWTTGGYCTSMTVYNGSASEVFTQEDPPAPEPEEQTFTLDPAEYTIDLTDWETSEDEEGNVSYAGFHITPLLDEEEADYTKIEWSSSDEEIATVVNSDVIPVAAGSVTITAVYTPDEGDPLTAECAITITDGTEEPGDEPGDETEPSETEPTETESSETEPTETEPTETEPTETEPTETEPTETEPTETEPAVTEPAATETESTLTAAPSGSSGGSGGYNVVPYGYSPASASSAAPSVAGDSGKSGWDAVAEEAASAGDSGQVVVDMNGATRVPSAILNEVKGMDVDLVLDMGSGITWTINGQDVSSAKAVDLGVTMSAHIPGTVTTTVEGIHKKQLSIKHDGDLGFTATMTVDLGNKYSGNYASIYYYDPKTKSLEFSDCDFIKDGKADFVFTHASEYLIVVTEDAPAEYEDVSSAASVKDDSADANMVYPVVCVTVLILAAAAAFAIYKKRARD